jgi:Family of unknown function (DUF6544)
MTQAGAPGERGAGRDPVAALDEPVRRYLRHAVAAESPPSPAVRLGMTGRIRLGAWLPFSAVEDADGRSFTWRARLGRGLLEVTDSFADGRGATRGRVLGRLRVLSAEGPDVSRSAAGRAALEAVWAPAALLPGSGVHWRAVDDHTIAVTLDVPPERPDVHLRIDDSGALRGAWARRWHAARDGGRYVPCGCEVHAERRFGPLTVPEDVTVGWGYGTPDWSPFFRARITSLAPVAPALP